MTRIKALQVLVYITFGLFILQDALPSAYKGFKEGYQDGYDAGHGNKLRGELLFTVLNGDLLTHQPHGDLQINKDYTLQNITINGELRLSNTLTTPVWLDITYFMATCANGVILLLMAITINKVIVRIAKDAMFDELCIKLIRRTACLLLLYAIGDYLYQQIAYLRNSSLVHAPFLSVANTSNFNFQALLCAIMVFIIAETFKQAALLKQEQDLTI